MNGFEKGKTQLFNSGGVVKLAYFQKKVEYPFKDYFFTRNKPSTTKCLNVTCESCVTFRRSSPTILITQCNRSSQVTDLFFRILNYT